MSIIIRYAKLILLIPLLLAAATASASSNTLIVFDASQSMLETFGGQTRLEAAKNSVYEFLGSANKETPVGLRLYAHVNHAGDKSAACRETTLAQNFTTTHGSIIGKVASTQAVGSYTPTAYALQQTKGDFTSGAENTLILLTDGKETCDGDPVTVAKELCEAGINVKTHVIGLGVDSETKTQLQSIASAGCGTYYNATDADSLGDSFNKIAEEISRPIDKTKVFEGIQVVRGGNQVSDAVELGVGEYTLDYHIHKNQLEYFFITPEVGERYYVALGYDDNYVRYDEGTDSFIEEGPDDNWYQGGRVFFIEGVKGRDNELERMSSSYNEPNYRVIERIDKDTITIADANDIENGYSPDEYTANPLNGNFDKVYIVLAGPDTNSLVGVLSKRVPLTIEKLESTMTAKDTNDSAIADNSDDDSDSNSIEYQPVLSGNNSTNDREYSNEGVTLDLYNDNSSSQLDKQIVINKNVAGVPLWYWLVAGVVLIIIVLLFMLIRKPKS